MVEQEWVPLRVAAYHAHHTWSSSDLREAVVKGVVIPLSEFEVLMECLEATLSEYYGSDEQRAIERKYHNVP